MSEPRTLAPPPAIRVEVVLAEAEGAVTETLKLPAAATVGDALTASRLAARQPAAVGVFGELASLDRPLRDGDRVDLLRPLLLAPQEARRRRATDRPPPAAGGSGART